MDKQTVINKLKGIYHKDIDIEDFEQFRKLTQTEKVWWHLQNFGTITGAIAKYVYGIHYCTSAILDIRKNLKLYGDNSQYIDSIDTKGVDMWGNKTNFSTYTLVRG